MVLLAVAVGCGPARPPAPQDAAPSPQVAAPAPQDAAPAPQDAAPAPQDAAPAPQDAAPAPQDAAPSAAAKVLAPELVRAQNALAFDLWRKVGAAQGNLAISPLSIGVALSMVWLGARGVTADELGKVLHAELDPGATAAAWRDVLTELGAPREGRTLALANRLFVDEGLAVVQAFADLLQTGYAAPAERLALVTAPEPARAHINAWVAEHTAQRIKDLLPSGAITPATRLVLANALYFLGPWQSPFDPDKTYRGTFATAPGTTKEVASMQVTEHLRLAQDERATVVELPYEGGDLAMLVVVPKAVDGLAALEAELGPATLQRWREGLGSVYVALSLPSFTIDPGRSIPLRDTLVALGMASAFDRERADFTGIAPARDGERLGLDEVLHQAYVAVDERGTEAAAATAALGRDLGGIPNPPLVVDVDRPFFFAILHRTSGLVLLTGRVTDPPPIDPSRTLRATRSSVGGADVGARVVVDDKALRVGPGLEAATVLNYVRRYATGVRWCYDDALRASPRQPEAIRRATPASGRATLRLRVDTTGATKDPVVADDSVGLDGLAACITVKAARWRFPAPSGGADVAVDIPFVFEIIAP